MDHKWVLYSEYSVSQIYLDLASMRIFGVLLQVLTTYMYETCAILHRFHILYIARVWNSKIEMSCAF